MKLPSHLSTLFWDYEFNELSWEKNRDLIIARILSKGEWSDVSWLRSKCSDEEIRYWIIKHKGSCLDPPRLRFWELILELPHKKVNAWVRNERRTLWEQRSP